MHEATKCGRVFESEADFAKHWKEERHVSITCIYDHCKEDKAKTVLLKRHEEFPFRPPRLVTTHQTKHVTDGRDTLELVSVLD